MRRPGHQRGVAVTISIADAARFAISVPRTPGKDPSGSEAFHNICLAISFAIDTKIQEMVDSGYLVRK